MEGIVIHFSVPLIVSEIYFSILKYRSGRKHHLHDNFYDQASLQRIVLYRTIVRDTVWKKNYPTTFPMFTAIGTGTFSTYSRYGPRITVLHFFVKHNINPTVTSIN